MRFDGPTFARALLAVMAATGDDKNIGTTYKTVALERHLRGVRLVASDSRLMLSAYVPDLEHHYDGPPEPEEPAEHVDVIADRKGRARGLMGHVLALSAETDPEAYAPGDIEVRVDFRGTRGHERGSGPVQPTLEGMEPEWVTIRVPGREQLNAEIVTNTFPDWRRIALHQSKRTLGVLLPPEQLEKLARIRKLARGPLEVTMGEKTALVQYPESDPHIAGVLVLADPEDPDVYQGDRERPDQEQAPPVDPDQTTIEDHIPDDLVDCPEQGCDYFADGSEDGDAALSDVVHHMMSRHSVGADLALRRIHGLEAATATAPDVMLADAAALTVGTQLGSAAQLKRHFRIGQARAARLMDELERRGIVGPADADSGRSRAVLLKADQVDQARQACER
jgi:hypothetical protein